MNKDIKRKQRSNSILLLSIYLVALFAILIGFGFSVYYQYFKPKPIDNSDNYGSILNDEYYKYNDDSGNTLLKMHVDEWLKNDDTTKETFIQYELGKYSNWIVNNGIYDYDWSASADNNNMNYINDVNLNEEIYKGSIITSDDYDDLTFDSTKEIKDSIVIGKNITFNSSINIDNSLVISEKINLKTNYANIQNSAIYSTINTSDIPIFNIILSDSIISAFNFNPMSIKLFDGDCLDYQNLSNIKDSFVDIL